MTNSVECYIGCPSCKTVLFRVERVERNAGVFENVIVPLVPPSGIQICDACGTTLARVPAPAPA